ncbi:hypothetical protein V8C35DRAFT_184504 [Trichoderma chlorosporum]
MFTSMWSLFGQRDEPPQPPPPPPPPVTFVGVRIPVDGSPAHLLPLTTISDSSATSAFLLHVPDLRSYWTSEDAWRLRDLHRLDLLQENHIPLSHHLRQKDDLQEVLRNFGRLSREKLLHLRQRYTAPQRYMVLKQQHHACVGAYYVMYSFASTIAGYHLEINKHVPRWISDDNDTIPHNYFGDVFLVKVRSHEVEEDGRAAYEDIIPEFLDLLVEGPLVE